MQTDYSTWTTEHVDLAIVERVFGWRNPRITGQNRLAGNPPGVDYRETMPRPSDDFEGMFTAVNAMLNLGWSYILSINENGNVQAKFCKLDSDNTWLEGIDNSDTPLLATCIAALRAKDAEGENAK